MHIARWIVLGWVCLGLTGASAAQSNDPRRDLVVEAVEKVMPSVVNIRTEEIVQVRDPLEGLFQEFFGPYYRRRPPNAQYSLGSGVVIDEEGFVLTNDHVVNRATRIWVKFSDDREYECEKITSRQSTDVALLRIKGKSEEKFRAVKFAPEDDLLLGETVLALGNPFGLGGSVSRGILSSKSRRPPKENEPLDIMDWLQTDAAINPGNSGGPLINLRGELIGISVAVYREGQGIGFAIPIKQIAASLAESYSPESLESLWFGARLRPGVLPLEVTSVQAESPAAKAGLKAGDKVLQLNGKSVGSYIEFVRQLMAAKNKNASLQIQRGTDRRTLTVRMVPQKTFFNEEMIQRKLGFILQEVTPELAQSLALPNVAGLVIADVEKNTPAAAADLQPGMLVTSIGGQPSRQIVSVAKLLYEKKPGDKVRVDVIYPVQRGPFLEMRQGTVELKVQ